MKYKITGSVTILGSGVNVHIKSFGLLGDAAIFKLLIVTQHLIIRNHSR